MGNCISAPARNQSAGSQSQAISEPTPHRNQRASSQTRQQISSPTAATATRDVSSAKATSVFEQATNAALAANHSPTAQQNNDTKKIVKIPSLVQSTAATASHYRGNQDQFDADTQELLHHLKSAIKAKKIYDFDDLLSRVGAMRQDAGHGESNSDVGIVREPHIETIGKTRPGDQEVHAHGTVVQPLLMSDPKLNHYAKLAKTLIVNLEEREKNKDRNLLSLDSKTLFTDTNFLENVNKNFYGQIRYIMPHYETDSGEKIRMTGTRVAIVDNLESFDSLPPDFLFADFLNTKEAIDELNSFHNNGPLKEYVPYSRPKNANEIVLVHCSGKHLTDACTEMVKQFDMFKQAYDSGDQEKAFDHAIDLVYLFANAAPYERGSAWGSEMIATALTQCIYEDAQADFFKTNLDFIAFGLDQYDFKEQFKDYVARSSNQQANS